jgi:hypothetical protein
LERAEVLSGGVDDPQPFEHQHRLAALNREPRRSVGGEVVPPAAEDVQLALDIHRHRAVDLDLVVVGTQALRLALVEAHLLRRQQLGREQSQRWAARDGLHRPGGLVVRWLAAHGRPSGRTNGLQSVRTRTRSGVDVACQPAVV